jgi:hypothetical protein
MKPRQHHLKVAGLLAQMAIENPERFLVTFGPAGDDAYLRDLWAAIGEEFPEEQRVPAEGIRTWHYLSQQVAILVLILPLPIGCNEAYFIGAIQPTGDSCRVFGLERSILPTTGEDCTVLSELTADGRSEWGPGGTPTVQDFASLLKLVTGRALKAPIRNEAAVAIFERRIAGEREKLDTWLRGAYADCEELRYCGEMDASYRNWGNIEALVGQVFTSGTLTQLSRGAVDSILFFISRSDEIGCIIAWLGIDSRFSGCGDLSYADFSFLAGESLRRAEDYCDYQIAACYRNLQQLSDGDVNVLKKFFCRTDSYTRRVALHSLQHFRHPDTVELARQLWHSSDCEFAKLSCLEALKAFPEARSLFDRFLAEYRDTYDIAAKEYRQSNLRYLLGEPGI